MDKLGHHFTYIVLKDANKRRVYRFAPPVPCASPNPAPAPATSYTTHNFRSHGLPDDHDIGPAAVEAGDELLVVVGHDQPGEPPIAR